MALQRMELRGNKEMKFALTIKKLFGLGRFLVRRTLWVIFFPDIQKIGLELFPGVP
jgi:hypothetical protein